MLKLFREVAWKFEWETFDWLFLFFIVQSFLCFYLWKPFPILARLEWPLPTKVTCLQSSKRGLTAVISWEVRVQYMFSYINYLPKCEKTGNKEKQNGGPRNVILNTTVYKAKMQVSQPNNVKIYNLSAGKSLPEVLKKSSYYILFIWKQFVFVLRFCTC